VLPFSSPPHPASAPRAEAKTTRTLRNLIVLLPFVFFRDRDDTVRPMVHNPRKLIASFILLAGLALSACSKPEDKIVGTWGIDLDATMAADDKLKALPEDQRKMAQDMAAGLFKEASFEFTKDGKMIANMAGKKEEGSYTVKSSDAEKVVLSTKDKNGKEEEITVTTKGDGLMLAIKDQKLFLKKK
jgi:hypothetical protein